MNGRSKRETHAYLRVAELGVVCGPLTTPQAFEMELGLTLGDEIADGMSGRQVSLGPAKLTDCTPWLDQRRIDVICRAVVRRFEEEQ